MKNRKEEILGWIKARKENNQKPYNCVFQITIPKFEIYESIENNKYIKEVIGILEKYNIKWNSVDSIGGAFCLNRDWIETSDIPCYVEYCGVYPTEWDIEDVVRLEQLEYNGDIIIKVLWHMEDGKYIANN